MISISTPDPKQSESYVATTALFLIFGSSAREDKVFLRLPAAWRDLWTEFTEKKKEKIDEADRASIRVFRDMVRKKRDQEEEDGVLIHGAFRNRGTPRPEMAENGVDKSTRSQLVPEAYQRIWAEKSSTPSYQMMLVRVPAILMRVALTVFSNHACNFQCGASSKKSSVQLIVSK